MISKERWGSKTSDFFTDCQTHQRIWINHKLLGEMLVDTAVQLRKKIRGHLVVIFFFSFLFIRKCVCVADIQALFLVILYASFNLIFTTAIN